MEKAKLISGQGLIEYALILVLIAMVVLLALRFFGPYLGGIFSQISSQLSS
jgi:pilus assembly protein Flp/PilA